MAIVAAAVNAVVILQEQRLFLLRMPRDLVNALAELREGIGREPRANAAVRRSKGFPPILAQVMAAGGDAEMHAVAEVYERDIQRVKIGQNATVWVQSSQAQLSGEVVRVGWKVGRKSVLDNDPIRDTDARVVEVRIKLDAASSELVSGLSNARVEVRIESREGG